MKYAPLVNKGDFVHRGQVIGYVGTTGNSTAPHLHWDIFKTKPKSWTVYTSGLTQREVRAIYLDPTHYLDGENEIPMKFNKYGYKYLSWVNSSNLYHPGLDLNFGNGYDDDGFPIRAPQSGVVEDVRYTNGWGNMLILNEQPMTTITGGKPSTLDDRDITHNELPKKDTKARVWGRRFTDQGDTPTCTANAVCSALYAITGKEFSRGAIYAEANELFEDSGDQTPGVSIRSAMRVLNETGAIPEGDVPFGKPWEEAWSLRYPRWKQQARDSKAKRKRFGYVRIPAYDYTQIDSCLHFTSPVVVAVRLYKGWDTATPYQKQAYTTVHAVAILEKVTNDTYLIMDSLNTKENDDGLRTIHKSNIIEAWGITGSLDIEKEGWDIRYGKPFDKKAELKASALIVDALTQLRRDDLWEEFVASKQMYLNAIAYGGYNASYWKLGRWFAGDIINYMHAKINGRTLPFNLEQPRASQ